MAQVVGRMAAGTDRYVRVVKELIAQAHTPAGRTATALGVSFGVGVLVGWRCVAAAIRWRRIVDSSSAHRIADSSSAAEPNSDGGERIASTEVTVR